MIQETVYRALAGLIDDDDDRPIPPRKRVILGRPIRETTLENIADELHASRGLLGSAYCDLVADLLEEGLARTVATRIATRRARSMWLATVGYEPVEIAAALGVTATTSRSDLARVFELWDGGALRPRAALRLERIPHGDRVRVEWPPRRRRGMVRR